MPPRLSSRRTNHVVTAVLVCHDGERWLPEVLRSLARQRRPPDRVVAVDTGSTDASLELLVSALGESAVVQLPSTSGFGVAVAAGLEHAASGPAPADPGPPQGSQEIEAEAGAARNWIWLLHDDCAPEPSALAELLRAATAAPRIAVFGPKARTWSGRYLAEVGASIDLTGRRDTGAERRELDQGQRDSAGAVLAVGSAGALISSEAWAALRGFDPRLPFFGNDLDFGWRAWRAGYEVAVVPNAVVRHAAAMTTRRRLLPGGNRFPARRAALYLLLANLPLVFLPVVVPRLAFATLLRATGLLLLRRPSAAWDELRALASVLLRPEVLLLARRRRSRTAAIPARSLRQFLAGPGARWRGYRDALALAASALPLPRQRPADRRSLLHLIVRPWTLLLAGLIVVSGIAERGLVGSALAGGRLLPAPGGASQLWSTYLAAFHEVGLGSTAAAPPTLPVLGVLSLPALGRPWVPVAVLLLGCVPLGGLAAYRAAGQLTASPLLRCWAGATWGLLPVATGAISGGRLDVAVTVIALPLLAGGVLRTAARDPRTSGWWRAFAAGLCLALAAAFAPLLYLAAAAAALVALAATFRRPALGRRIAAVLGLLAVAFLVLFPWSVHVARDVDLLLAGPGLADPAPAAAVHDLLLFDPGGPAGAPGWLFAPVLLCAAAAWLRRGRWGAVAAGWLALLTGCIVAALLDRARVSVAGVGSGVWPGVPLAVAAAGALSAAVIAGDGARARLADLAFGWRQPAAGVLAAASAAVPIAAAGSWLVQGVGGPITAARASTAPAYLAAEAQGGGRRVLGLSVPASGPVHFALLYQGASPELGDDAVQQPVPDPGLAGAVTALVSGTGAAAGPTFARTGVGYLVVTGAGAGVVDRRLAGAPGLTRLAGAGDWAVSSAPTRLTVLAGPAGPLPLGSGPSASLPAGDPGRLLVLSELRSPGWRATLDGRPLAAATAYGWAQAFRLPTTGGTVSVGFNGTAHSAELWAQLALLLLVLVLAAPARPARQERS